MGKAVGKVFILLIVLLAIFLWVGNAITKLTGGEKKPVKAGEGAEVGPEAGEGLFWDKGRCFTCHSLGDRGSAIRGPNLGVSGDRFPLAIGARAAERAKERAKQTGLPYTAVDYVVECMGEPGAYVVEGFKNEMIFVAGPPISLSLDEIKSIAAYLLSQGGEVDMNAIQDPSEVAKKYYDKIVAASDGGEGKKEGEAAAAPPAKTPEEVVNKYGCVACHTVAGGQGKVGPDLTKIGAKRDMDYIRRAILEPGADIAQGFPPGIMPPNFKDKMTAGEFDLIVHYLASSK
ncbi:MAG: cytochrome c [Nitrospirae bacterium]|nr:cytochrome c [Nitrospirota bacterium]